MVDRTVGVKQPVFYGWWIVGGCFIMLFLFAGAGFYSFSIFIRPLEKAFGWSRSQIALAMSINLVVHGMMAPLVGHLLERYGTRRIMSIFTAGYGAAFLVVSRSDSLWFFYLSYVFLAIMGTGVGFVPVSAVLARWFIRRRGTAIGIAMVGISAGGMVMSPLIEILNASYTWRGAYVFLAILVWVIGLPVTLLVIRGNPGVMGLQPDNDPPQAVIGDDAGSSDLVAENGWPLKAALRSRVFWLVTATFVLAPGAQMGVIQHQVPLITDIGISGTTAAAALGFTAGLGGAGKLSFGRISELIPVHYTALLCFGLQALGVFILMQATSMAWVWAYVFIFGFVMGGLIVLLPIVIGQHFGLASFGVLMGIVTFFQALGAGSGAIISGLVYDATGSYDMALMLYIALYLLAILTIFSAGRPREYRSAD